jgi:hypothetical protein
MLTQHDSWISLVLRLNQVNSQSFDQYFHDNCFDAS